MISAVLFDLDGTLIDSLPQITEAVNATLSEAGRPPLASDTVRGFVGRGERVLMRRLVTAAGLPMSDAERLLPSFIDHYQRAARATRLLPGADEALRQLEEAGVRLGLVTNKPRAPLVPTLAAAGLSERFGIVVAGDDLPERKPDPAPLIHAKRALGATRAIYVGDSEVDAETAGAAGMPFALHVNGIRTTPASEIPRDAAFEDFAELPEICLRLLETRAGDAAGLRPGATRAG